MHRWTARFLLLVMLVLAFGPLALAHIATPTGMHCARRPLAVSNAAPPPSMHCHEAAPQNPAPHHSGPQDSASPEASFRSLDCCRQNCDCCRGPKTSEWAHPATNLICVVGLLIQPASLKASTPHIAAFIAGPDSARAPPRR